jgi:hypothetical protein
MDLRLSEVGVFGVVGVVGELEGANVDAKIASPVLKTVAEKNDEENVN